MANYASLKAAIQQVVKTNGNNEITGALLQQSLLAMINSLGAGYQYMGIATPSTNPGTPDQNVFYLAATAGTYTNFDSITVNENEAVILKYNGSWSKDSAGFATSEQITKVAQQIYGEIGFFGTENVNGFTIVNVDVRYLPRERYFVRCYFIGDDVPEYVMLWEQRGVSSGNLVQHAMYNGVWNDFIMNAECGNLLFFSNENHNYTLKYEIISESQLYKNQIAIEEIFSSKQTTPIVGQNGFVTSDGIAKAIGKEIYKTGIKGSQQINNATTFVYADISAFPKEKIYVRCFLDGNDAPVSITLWEQETRGGGNITSHTIPNNTWVDFVINENCNWFLFFSSYIKTYTLKYEIIGESQIHKNQIDVEALAEELESAIIVKESMPVSPSSTYSGHYISNDNGDVAALGVYDLLLVNVQPGEKYRINASGQLGNARVFAVYNTNVPANFSSSTARLCTDKQVKDDVYPMDLTIPDGGVVLAVQKYSSAYVYIYKIEEKTIQEELSEIKESGRFYYTLSNNVITIIQNNNGGKLSISLGPGGGNNLFDFRAFQKEVNGQMVQFHYNDSDWFGPFKIYAINNIDGDDLTGDTFTGGAHQYNNGLSGSTPTARQISLQFYLDGKQITSGAGYANCLKIKWTNNIQATNTKKADGTGREVLTENIILSFDGKVWYSETELVPIEDINITLWYGYQMTGVGSAMGSHWKYINGSRVVDAVASGNDKCNIMEQYGGNCDVRMELLNDFDMGDRSFCASGLTNSAFKSGTKGYFMVVNTRNQIDVSKHYYLACRYYFNVNQ